MPLDLESLFTPQSLAVIGASKKRGYRWLKRFSRFHGKLYGVNPAEGGKRIRIKIRIKRQGQRSEQDISVTMYKSVLDIPNEVDFAFIAVPAKIVPTVLKECVQKGVKNVAIFSAGYSESGTEEGRKKEDELKKIAEGKINLIGPNCVGVYYPKNGMSFNESHSLQPGDVAFVAQSGGHAQNFTIAGEHHGIKFSKVISYGNGCMIDSPDLIEFLANDPETKIITAYIEGVKEGNGKRLKDVLTYASGLKTVIIWKGGQTAEGAKAAMSHTGSIAGDAAIWNAVFKQSGCISVDSLEELLDTTIALRSPVLPKSTKIGVLSASGGQSVALTDYCSKGMLEMPHFSDITTKKLFSVIPTMGTSVKNPLDASGAWYEEKNVIETISIVSEDGNVDSLLIELIPHFIVHWLEVEVSENASALNLAEFISRKREEVNKPFFLVISPLCYEQETSYFRSKMLQNGIPVYPDFYRAVRALNNLYRII
jgi:acyl-CoA synthetase (NDP forming)